MNVGTITAENPYGENTEVGHVGSSDGRILFLEDVSLETKKYTLSMWVKASENSTITIDKTTREVATSWQKKEFTFTHNEEDVYLTFGSGEFWIYEAKLEEGTFATSFTIDPEDTDAIINDITTKVLTQGTNLSVVQGQIATKIWQTDIDTATNEINSKYSAVTQTIDGLSANVGTILSDYATHTEYQQLADKFTWIVSSGESASSMVLTDKVYSLISNNITLTGNHIQLNGNTTVADGFILSADHINANSLESIVARIGGFDIGATALYNGTDSMLSMVEGVYLGTDGFRQYKDADNFVDIQNGVLAAKNVDLTGSFTSSIDAEKWSGYVKLNRNGLTFETNSKADFSGVGNYRSFFNEYELEICNNNNNTYMTIGSDSIKMHNSAASTGFAIFSGNGSMQAMPDGINMMLYGDFAIIGADSTIYIGVTAEQTGVMDMPTNVSICGGVTASDGFHGTINGCTISSSVPAGAQFTDTNTWRGIQNTLGSTSTSDSLSAYQGYLLANGSARDSTKMPTSGGTFSGNITVSGSLHVPDCYTNTTTSSADVRVTSNGLMRKYSSSSRRYKYDISLLNEEPYDPRKLLDIEVVQYRYKPEYLGSDDKRYMQLIPGFIAEQVESLLPICCDYNEDGQVEMWNHYIMLPMMLRLQQIEHDDFEQKYIDLLFKYNELQARVTQLESEKAVA